jgi:hypothetical protein
LERFICQISPRGRLRQRLGPFRGTSHKFWNWRLDSGRGILARNSSRNNRYHPAHSNRWVRTTQGIPQRANGEVYSVMDLGAGSVTILSSIEYFPSTPTPTYFWEALKKYGTTLGGLVTMAGLLRPLLTILA